MIVVILIAIFSMTFIFLMYYGYYEALSGDYQIHIPEFKTSFSAQDDQEKLLDKAKEKNFTMYKKEYKTRKNLDSQAITEHNGQASGRLSSKTI